MIQEHHRVVLTRDLPGEELVGGDVGTFVHVYADGKSLEIEFMTLDGRRLLWRRSSSTFSLMA